ncbi:uncharacterized protein Z520_08103 [Fonsecaea multimorphosa CBS 102226]|uniref:Homeobox domain-containing protein n=1 Tax=Fonsecaea multimorphosa CBS 102226 TaxID=1442371 RepID=A0A0D2H3B3_9EURO|nr:uncharacterized protein Z520_08103 [Fonsecaea multimorphosa CBS 102226]KIX96325.1 hypothetical protein Z520_08103 [Fonsecaea multimorphosa CBS 102226]OAL21984.1 hypothetical protein AYO22_07581 [Fonsecaea multimorphosa]
MGQDAGDTTEPAPQHAPYDIQLHHHSISPSGAPLAVKAKRRRTRLIALNHALWPNDQFLTICSPQDCAVLEAAYQQNSKPDKAERALIVSRVALGEKEVQIWFQNRRQNDRRRSKPLQPHELVAHLRNSNASPAPPQMSSSPSPEDLSASSSHPSSSLAPIEPFNRPTSRGSSIHDLLNPTIPEDDASLKHSSQETVGGSTPPSSFEKDVLTVEAPLPSETQKKVTEICDGRTDVSSEHGSARKRDHDEMTGAHPPCPRPERQEKTGEAVISKGPLLRASSFVRLAMTVDGAVKVRTNNEPTPSPEKPRASTPTMHNRQKASLVRSKSAVNEVEVFRDSVQGAGPKSIGGGFGRSRDARTWEFYCDSKTKDALSTQAEAESAGSAVSAINLIRSNSFKPRLQALSPSLSKTNSQRATGKGDRPKLSRAKSSLGRLQGLDSSEDPSSGKPKLLHGHVRSPSEDSDKENWAPGTRMSEHPLRRTQPSTCSRPVLQENEQMTFPDVNSSHKRPEGGPSNRESPTKETAKGEEFDCVQGLLSLSQGAWSR